MRKHRAVFSFLGRPAGGRLREVRRRVRQAVAQEAHAVLDRTLLGVSQRLELAAKYC
jgi:hypothetical protein